ncbi:MAG: hypothetical protein CM15mP21_3190 [Hyphomicrobiales bacterium]|nr:MAG: hypothetical protein CM15mP21_3190 [Hyphomicrobiales bacterium]
MSERFSLRGIHQSFDQAGRRLKFLNGVDLTIAAGETVALLGPSVPANMFADIAGLLKSRLQETFW